MPEEFWQKTSSNKKSLWQSLKNQKSELTVLLHFLLNLSWRYCLFSEFLTKICPCQKVSFKNFWNNFGNRQFCFADCSTKTTPTENRSMPRWSWWKMLQNRNYKRIRGCFLGGIICLTAFLVSLWKKPQNRQFCIANFFMKIDLQKKIKYTKIVNSVFDFKSFVTEIFYLKFAIFKMYWFFIFFRKWQILDKISLWHSFENQNSELQFSCIFCWQRCGILFFQ